MTKDEQIEYWKSKFEALETKVATFDKRHPIVNGIIKFSNVTGIPSTVIIVVLAYFLVTGKIDISKIMPDEKTLIIENVIPEVVEQP